MTRKILTDLIYAYLVCDREEAEKLALFLISNGVEIPVRCDDCIFYGTEKVEGNAKCCTGENGSRYRKPCDYCSRGVRK